MHNCPYCPRDFVTPWQVIDHLAIVHHAEVDMDRLCDQIDAQLELGTLAMKFAITR